MKRTALPTLLCALALCTTTVAQRTRRPAHAHADLSAATIEQVNSQTLPIRRVILYSNGVAYIERRGTVTGHAEVALSFKQSQVDDVLKSMIVLDLGRGRVGAVSYNSSAPPEARIADIPFSVAAQSTSGGGLAGVLGQLQGARVVVTTAKGTATGSILTVEERRTQTDPAKPPTVIHALVIASDGGELMSFDLADVRAVKLVDEGTRRDITEFARATASMRRRDAKTIVVTSDGVGAREMVVSYTIAAPIWKTTYRVVLDDKGQPFFQGWAIVDNVSEEDWRDVELSLISGTPVSFIQPLQQPLYRYRPVVPIPQDLQLNPQTYEPSEGNTPSGSGALTGTILDANGAVIAGANVSVKNDATNQEFNATTNSEGTFRLSALPAGSYTLTASMQAFKQFVANNVRVSAGHTARLRLTLEVASVSENVTIDGTNFSDMPLNARAVNGLLMLAPGTKDKKLDIGAAMTDEESGVEAEAEGAEMGADLFAYHIAQPVTVPRDRSALIPIVQTRMTGERISVFNEAARAGRPFSGLKLKNDTQLTLESGALTVIDGNAYAGEALMERLKPGEERLVSFALDLGTLVRVETEESNAPVFHVRIASGVLQAHYHEREQKVYTLTNQTDRPRIVYVEHPVREEWELDPKETPAPAERTARYYRFRVELAPHAHEELTVVERHELLNTYALANFSPNDLELFVARRYVDEPTRAALQHLLDLKARTVALDARLQAVNAEIATIGEDQKRLRDNIATLKNTSEAKQLIARYVAKAGEQETRIEQLTRERQTILDERQRAQAELAAALRALNLERDLGD
jgi:Carboxypeptidase regulatory-like domain